MAANPIGGAVTGFEDIFTKINMPRKHYSAAGLGAEPVAGLAG